MTPPSGGTYSYGYDGLHRLVSVTPPPPSVQQTFRYDGLGRVTRRTLGTSTWMQSWASGAASLSTPGGDSITTLFDGRNRPVSKHFVPGASSVNDVSSIDYEYDVLGALVSTSETRPSGPTVTEYVYGPRHLLLSVSRGGQPQVGFGYFDDGQRASVTVSGVSGTSGASHTYTYDSLRRLASVSGLWGTTSVSWVPGGSRLASLTDSASAFSPTQAWVYDSQGNVRRVGPTEYTYDARGNPVSESRPGFARSATYDDANRLVSVTEADGLHQYILHPDGRRASEVLPNGHSLAYGYNSTLGALTSVVDSAAQDSPEANVSLSVDSSGRVSRVSRASSVTSADGVDSFTWSPDGRLVAANGVSFTYDALGLRRTASDSRQWVYVGEELLGESFFPGPATGLQTSWQLGALTLAQGDVRFVVDALGSPVSDSQGNFTSFSAWGVPSRVPAVGSPSVSFTGYRAESKRLQFGQQRWLLAGLGVFASMDPVGPQAYLQAPNGLGPWTYGNLGPLRYTDPDGRGSKCGTEGGGGTNAPEDCGGRAHPCDVDPTSAECHAAKLTKGVVGGAAITAVCTVTGGAPCVAALIGGALTSEQPTITAIDSTISSCADPLRRSVGDCHETIGAFIGGALASRPLSYSPYSPARRTRPGGLSSDVSASLPEGAEKVIPHERPPSGFANEGGEFIDDNLSRSTRFEAEVRFPSQDAPIPGAAAGTARSIRDVGAEVSQKQLRHILGRPEWVARGKGGYFQRAVDAQAVLDAARGGKARVLGVTKQGHIVVEYGDVTGFNNNPAAGFVDQPTNVFMIKGTKSPSVVPISPTWKP